MWKLFLAGVALALTCVCGRGGEGTSERAVPLETVGKQPAKAASPAAAQEVEESVEYVVCVDALNLRAEPTDEAEVLEVLKRGARVENLSEVVTAVDRRRLSGRR